MKINCTPQKFDVIESLPDGWKPEDFKQLLELMEFDDTNINTEELEEMCLLSLTDFEPEEAAAIVLQYLFETELNSGQIQNLSHEMQDEKIWEEYANIAFHERFFNVGELLYKAFDGSGFPHPKAVSVKVTFNSEKEKLPQELLDKDPTTIVKLISKGLPDNAILNRLYHEQLETEHFEEAKDILWQIRAYDVSEKSISFELISSLHWLEDFKYTEAYSALIENS